MITPQTDRRELGRALFRLTWPMLFGVAALLGFQLVDSAFVGQLGVAPLAALGFTVPVQQLIIGLQVGLGIATTALVSKALGAKRLDKARELSGLVVAAGTGAITILCLSLWWLRTPLLSLLGAEAALLPVISGFWLPWLFSAWLGAVLYFGYSIARANGNTRLPGMLMALTSLINLALDPLFIFVFDWGLPGAAWATVVAFGTGIAIVFPRIIRRGWMTARFRDVQPREGLAELGRISGPASVSQLLPPVSAMLATALVAAFGSTAVAAWGLGTRMEFFSIVVVLALTMSLPPMLGRYLGAGQLDEVRLLIRIAVRFTLLWQAGIAVAWMLLSGVLADLLSDDPAVADRVREYLLKVPLSYGGLGVCMLMVSVCNALGMPLRALTISALRLFVCYLPALWIGSQLAGLSGLFTAALIGNVAAGFVGWRLYRAGLKHVSGQSPDRPTGQEWDNRSDDKTG
ncbi:MATE family efflux transporter [Hydrocarboniclastica marina]|uniref:MATE family efflux transporter n=1 Tax=Hydrocarboniclastica marina TaxID=2259620 RepID=A0A4P7XED5_9ALTE|nr:MATE family efflux transporter [Hydrocarboniclastica marina]QCF25248.1 MATE family efflux transporter [Hydrocarboniclastica marina]